MKECMKWLMVSLALVALAACVNVAPFRVSLESVPQPVYQAAPNVQVQPAGETEMGK